MLSMFQNNAIINLMSKQYKTLDFIFLIYLNNFLSNCLNILNNLEIQIMYKNNENKNNLFLQV